MDQKPASGPLPVPAGVQITSASSKGLVLVLPAPVAEGTLIEFDLVLGARPLSAMGRVIRVTGTAHAHQTEVEFVAMAQVDRDILADFLQAVGPSLLRLRAHREGA